MGILSGMREYARVAMKHSPIRPTTPHDARKLMGGVKQGIKFGYKHHPAMPVMRPDAARKLVQASGVPQMASDAKWAFTHPRDRVMGRGRARGTKITSGPFKGLYRQDMIMPVAGSGGAGLIPGEFKSSIPGFRILRSKPGDTRMTWDGMPEEYTRSSELHHGPFEPGDYLDYVKEKHPHLRGKERDRMLNKLWREHEGTSPINYNLVKKGDPLTFPHGSLAYALHPKHVYAGEVFIEPGTDIRAFKDFADIITRHNKPIEANFANERLGNLFDKLVARGRIKRANTDLTEMELWDLNRELTMFQRARMARTGHHPITGRRIIQDDELRGAINELRLNEPPHGMQVDLSPGGRPINRRRSGR